MAGKQHSSKSISSKRKNKLITFLFSLPKLDIPESLPLVFADLGLVERVIQNLMDNALKFTPSGGSVTIALAAQDESVEVRIADTGPGIPEQEQAAIFETALLASSLLYETSKDQQYLAEAFTIAEKGKAGLLRTNLSAVTAHGPMLSDLQTEERLFQQQLQKAQTDLVKGVRKAKRDQKRHELSQVKSTSDLLSKIKATRAKNELQILTKNDDPLSVSTTIDSLFDRHLPAS